MTGNENKNKNSVERVFSEIQTQGPIMRREIQNNTGLSWGAVSTVTSNLIKAGLVFESETDMGTVGRRPQEVDINVNDHFFLGIDLNFTGLIAVAIDLKGNVIKSRVSAMLKNNYEYVLDSLFQMLDYMINRELAGYHFLGVGIAVQGVVDRKNGISCYCPYFANWDNVPLKSLVEEKFNIQTFIYHDPVCVLQAERYFDEPVRALDSGNVIVIRFDKGIGMSMMFNSEIYEGATGIAGEIGHSIVKLEGALCSCGKRGCLESYASMNGLVQRFYEAVNEGEKTCIEGIYNCSYETLASYASKGDPLCLELFANAGRYIGYALANLIGMLEPDVIILYGKIIEQSDLFEKEMRRVVKENIWPVYKTKIVLSQLGGDAPAAGAAHMGLKEIVNDFVMKEIERKLLQNEVS